MRIKTLITMAALSAWTVGARADDVPPEYFGVYPGIEWTSIANGASWEDSTSRLEIDAEGLTLHAHRDRRGRQWKIRYSKDWIVSAFDGCLGIKRHAQVERPELLRVSFVLCFQNAPDGLRRVVVADSEGEPLGEYYRSPHQDQSRVSWRLRDRFEDLSERLSLRTTAADMLATFASGDQLAQIAALKTLGGFGPDLAEKSVAGYLAVIERALRDEDHRVQVAALKAIDRGLRVTGALAVVRSLIRDPGDVHPDVLSHATQALAGVVYDANQLFGRREKFRQAFGTSDLDEIFERTEGIIVATNAPISLLDVFKLHPPASRAWTPEHREQALRALDKIANEGSSPDVQREARNATKYLGQLQKPQICQTLF